jgi:hypothetical protein
VEKHFKSQSLFDSNIKAFYMNRKKQFVPWTSLIGGEIVGSQREERFFGRKNESSR